MSIIVALTQTQINTLTDLQANDYYPEAYRQMQSYVNDAAANATDAATVSELNNLSNWLDKAASINSNDGSLASDFVRGATEGIYEQIKGVPPAIHALGGAALKRQTLKPRHARQCCGTVL